MHVLYTRATRLPPSSVTSHSIKPSERVRFTTCAVARKRALQTGLRNFTARSSDVNDSPSSSVEADRRAQRRVGHVAHDAAVQRPHRIGVLRTGVQLEHRVAEVDRDEPEPDEPRDGRRLGLAAEHRAQLVEMPGRPGGVHSRLDGHGVSPPLRA